jgi:hypothetical protein
LFGARFDDLRSPSRFDAYPALKLCAPVTNDTFARQLMIEFRLRPLMNRSLLCER